MSRYVVRKKRKGGGKVGRWGGREREREYYFIRIMRNNLERIKVLITIIFTKNH